MLVEAQVTINGSRSAVWTVITDIENASEIMTGIEKIEVLERPANGKRDRRTTVARDSNAIRQARYRGKKDHGGG